MFCHGEMGPPRMCDVLNERYIQSVGPNLQARGIYGKGKDRAVELDLFDSGRTREMGGGEQAERQRAELSW